MCKYLFIDENAKVEKTNEEPNKDDLDSCDYGIFQIIRLSDLTYYSSGEWQPLEEFKKD